MRGTPTVVHQVPALDQNRYVAYLLQPPALGDLSEVIRVVNSHLQLQLDDSQESVVFQHSCYGNGEDIAEVKKAYHIGRTAFSLHVGHVCSKIKPPLRKSYSILVSSRNKRSPTFATWGLCLLAPRPTEPMDNHYIEIDMPCLALYKEKGDNLSDCSSYELFNYLSSPNWTPVSKAFLHFPGGKKRKKGVRRKTPSLSYWLPAKLFEALKMAALPRSYSVVLQELWDLLRGSAVSCNFTGLKSCRIEKGARDYSKLVEAALKNQVPKAAKAVICHEKGKADFTVTAGIPEYTMPDDLQIAWDSASDMNIEELCEKQKLEIHKLHPSVALDPDYEMDRQRLVFDISVPGLAECLPKSSPLYGVVDLANSAPSTENGDEFTSTDDRELSCHSVAIVWHFKNEAMHPYHGFHVIKRVDFTLNLLTLKAPVVLPTACDMVWVEIGRYSGNGAHVWPELRNKWLTFAQTLNCVSASDLPEQQETQVKKPPSFLDLCLEEHFDKGLERTMLYLGGPGVSKTSVALTSNISEDLETQNASLVCTYTTESRNHASECLLPNDNVRIVGEDTKFTGLEADHTLHGHLWRLAHVDSAEQNLQDHVANYKVCGSSWPKVLPVQRPKNIRESHAAVIAARESQEGLRAELRDSVLNNCTTVLSTLGALARQDAVKEHEIRHLFKRFAIYEASFVDVGSFVEVVLLNQDLFDQACLLDIIGDHLRDGPPSMASMFGRDRTDMQWLQDQWSQASLFQYVLSRLHYKSSSRSKQSLIHKHVIQFNT